MNHKSMSEAKAPCFMFCAFDYMCTSLLFRMSVDACVMWKEAIAQRESRSLLVAYRAAGVEGRCWRANRGTGRSWFLIESLSPPRRVDDVSAHQHTPAHSLLLSNFPADGSKEVNTSGWQ